MCIALAFPMPRLNVHRAIVTIKCGAHARVSLSGGISATVLLFALVVILGREEDELSLYDASLSEWAVTSLPMTNPSEDEPTAL